MARRRLRYAGSGMQRRRPSRKLLNDVQPSQCRKVPVYCVSRQVDIAVLQVFIDRCLSCLRRNHASVLPHDQAGILRISAHPISTRNILLHDGGQVVASKLKRVFLIGQSHRTRPAATAYEVRHLFNIAFGMPRAVGFTVKQRRQRHLGGRVPRFRKAHRAHIDRCNSASARMRRRRGGGCRSRQQKASRLIAFVDSKPDSIPKLRRILPLVDKMRSCTFKQHRGLRVCKQQIILPLIGILHHRPT